MHESFVKGYAPCAHSAAGSPSEPKSSHQFALYSELAKHWNQVISLPHLVGRRWVHGGHLPV
jgi:hypothetical protein